MADQNSPFGVIQDLLANEFGLDGLTCDSAININLFFNCLLILDYCIDLCKIYAKNCSAKAKE
jgi:hypothetical protein